MGRGDQGQGDGGDKYSLKEALPKPGWSTIFATAFLQEQGGASGRAQPATLQLLGLMVVEIKQHGYDAQKQRPWKKNLIFSYDLEKWKGVLWVTIDDFRLILTLTKTPKILQQILGRTTMSPLGSFG